MKFIAFISLVALLCTGLSHDSIISHVHQTAVSHTDKSQHERYTAVTTNDLFCNIAHNESSVSASGSNASSGIRDFFSDFSTLIQIDRQLTANLFFQYTFYARHLITRLQNTDIIFPFHYFW